MANSSSDSEEWIAYRKLVIDTLSKLDERSIELYGKMADLTARVNALENSGGSSKEIEYIEASVETLDSRVTAVETNVSSLNTTRAIGAARNDAILWIGGIIWTTITVGLALLIAYIKG